jgi:hypothetical protein
VGPGHHVSKHGWPGQTWSLARPCLQPRLARRPAARVGGQGRTGGGLKGAAAHPKDAHKASRGGGRRRAANRRRRPRASAGRRRSLAAFPDDPARFLRRGKHGRRGGALGHGGGAWGGAERQRRAAAAGARVSALFGQRKREGAGKGVRARKRERKAAGWSYPLIGLAGGGVHLLGRSGDGERCHRAAWRLHEEDDEEKAGWASLGRPGPQAGLLSAAPSSR